MKNKILGLLTLVSLTACMEPVDEMGSQTEELDARVRDNPSADVLTSNKGAPEIQVLVGAVDLVDGQAQEVQVGQAIQGAASPSLNITVKNIGTKILSSLSVSVPGSFLVTNPLVSELAPGVSDILTISLPTNNVGLFSGPAIISSDDADEAQFNIALSGTISSAPVLGQFVAVPSSYVRGSGVDISFTLNSSAPAGAYVIFQTWSVPANAVQGALTDSTAPFVYQDTSLDTVSLGNAELQAIVRSASGQNLATIRASNLTNFLPAAVSSPNISYSPSAIVGTVGQALNAVPSNSGGVISSCTILPALPAGILFNVGTCGLSGSPSASQSSTSYTVTATNSGGSSQKVISIQVNSGSTQQPQNPNQVPSGPISLNDGSNTISNLNITSSNGAGIMGDNATHVTNLTVSNTTIRSFNYGIYCGDCTVANFSNLDVTAEGGGDSYSVRGVFENLTISDSIFRADAKSHRFYGVLSGNISRSRFIGGRFMAGGGYANEWTSPGPFHNVNITDSDIDVDSMEIYNNSNNITLTRVNFTGTGHISIQYGAHHITFNQCQLPQIRFYNAAGNQYTPSAAELASRSISIIP